MQLPQQYAYIQPQPQQQYIINQQNVITTGGYY